ncbi:MAG: conjugal transfer protein TraF [Planctomycetes bacterium]|nr:conjugal transfer protein TraF [Planctomycetota bacterium]
MATLACLALAAGTQGQDSYIIGPRALGMAGANVASTDDYTAQFYNPAAFGFFRHRTESGERLASDSNDLGRKRWGFGVDVGASTLIQGHMGDYLDQLSKVNDIDTSGIQSAEDVQRLVAIANSLAHISDTGNAVTSDVNGGAGLRIGPFGLGVRTTFQATGRVDQTDLINVAFGTPITNAQVQSGGATGDGTVQVFTPAQQAQLTGAGLNNTSIQVLDLYARQQGLSGTSDANTIQLLVNSIVQSNSGSPANFKNNQTRVTFRGFGVAEVPLTYGLALGEHISVGGSLKLMIGRVYGTTVRVFDDNADNVISSATKNYKQSVNVGLDLGVMARIPMLQVGLVGRNLNAPTFEGPTVTDSATGITTRYSDVRVDPQATLGVAFIPATTLVIEADCDLNAASTTLPGYDTQRLSGGIEWNPGRVIALRGGVYKNLAESDVPFVVTGGVGFNLYIVRLDLAAAMSPKKVQFQGKSFPKEGRVAFGLSVDF